MNQNYINDPDAIVCAALDCIADDVAFCLSRGDDVNAADSLGRTALHAAAQEGCMDIATMLIEHGANVQARNKAGDTPLDYAVFHEHRDLADLLRKHGAVDRKGQSALQYDRDTEAIGWASMQSVHRLLDEIKKTEPPPA
jgi:serine/threonine-protein phosphatase 6 regulatory ankyrin repeat subunit B